MSMRNLCLERETETLSIVHVTRMLGDRETRYANDKERG